MNVKPGFFARTLHFTFIILHFAFINSCSPSTQISRQASKILLNDTAISSGHIGISIYEPATEKYWYNYQADKYFIPASNTKLLTLYAGMKYLGDSLVGMRIADIADTLFLIPAADPTLLHPAFAGQPVYDLLISTKKQLQYISIPHNFESFGKGWAWDDYNDSYMAERSALPVFGNTVTFSGTKDTFFYSPKKGMGIYDEKETDISKGYINAVKRDILNNDFFIFYAGILKQKIKIPFKTSDEFAFDLLQDSIHKSISIADHPGDLVGLKKNSYPVHSRPVDSLFKPMMYNSDNLFAEQVLLMAADEHLGYMTDKKMIDTLLSADLKDIPQIPRWVDGSGLSRYNLFTPLSFIYILNKMKNEFGLERLKNILPTGGEGTLRDYYVADSLFIYAKTGSMSNQATISGLLITKKGKLLFFSVLANNFIINATPVRRAVEKFLEKIRNKY